MRSRLINIIYIHTYVSIPGGCNGPLFQKDRGILYKTIVDLGTGYWSHEYGDTYPTSNARIDRSYWQGQLV